MIGRISINKRLFVMITISMTLIVASSAWGMTADEFLTRSQSLQAKGMMAALDRKEISALGTELGNAGLAYRADLNKLPPGDTSLGCPPPQGKAGNTPDVILSQFSAIPEERRKRITVKAAFYDMMRTRFPCPAASAK